MISGLKNYCFRTTTTSNTVGSHGRHQETAILRNSGQIFALESIFIHRSFLGHHDLRVQVLKSSLSVTSFQPQRFN